MKTRDHSWQWEEESYFLDERLERLDILEVKLGNLPMSQMWRGKSKHELRKPGKCMRPDSEVAKRMASKSPAYNIVQLYMCLFSM